MILNAEKIKAEKLIANPDENNYRSSSYDVSIGEIILSEGTSVTELDEYTLLPQGVVEVVSDETFQLPKNVTGYAMVKTSLCNEGILPLNIGIIDPGYKGPISATLLNFSKKEFNLSKGKIFLRVTFHECYESKKVGPKEKSRQQYISERKDKALNFAPKFLNLDLYIKDATKQFNDEFKATLWKVLPIVGAGIALTALLVTIFSFLVTLGVNWGNRNYWTKEDLKSEIIKEVKANQDSKNEEKIKELEEKIKKFEAMQMQSNQTVNK